MEKNDSHTPDLNRTKNHNVMADVMRSASRVFSILSLALLVCACGGKPAADKGADPLRDRVLTYWESAGASPSTDMEQKIVDYLYLLQHCDSTTRAAGWEKLQAATGNQLDKTVAAYLGTPDSPLYSPAMFEEYLSSLVRLLPQGDADRERAAYLLGNVGKNKPGRRISDLQLRGADGQETTLLARIDESDKDCLIFFYDPDCEACDETIASLSRNGENGYHIIAINVTDKEKKLPEEWETWKAADTDELEEKFYFPTLPATYYLSSDASILRRE